MRVTNFGRNLQFTPRCVAAPKSEAELLELLQQNNRGQIRVMGSRHSWSPLIETDGILIDMHCFHAVKTFQKDGQTFAEIGGGAQIKHILSKLNAQGLTLPSVGLITEQTISGATSTGTHGSGKHSLSHYLHAVRLACFDESGQQARMVTLDHGPELQAARCGLGLLGVVVSVVVPCIPQYFVEERLTPVDSVSDAMALEREWPLQQFFLLPHGWTVYVQGRRVSERHRRSAFAWLYRIYWFLLLDVGLHLLILLAVRVLKSTRLIRWLFRRLVPATIIPGWTPIDRSDRQLTMEHELFRHLECEIFVRRPHLLAASDLVQDILRLADDSSHDLNETTRSALSCLGLLDQMQKLAGTYCHHYPICIRRILPDDTLISMSSRWTTNDQSPEDWYSISLITYASSRETFFAFATALATVMVRLFDARLHWGKWCPDEYSASGERFPKLDEFRQVCQHLDPGSVFRNRFTDRISGFSKQDSCSP
jgi:hypothetical protein